MLGKHFSPILEEMEDALWEFEALNIGPPQFTDEGFRASCKIFMAALMDKMWVMQSKENMLNKDREKMAEYAGQEIRKLIKVMTNIDTKDLY